MDKGAWGCEESDITERACTYTRAHTPLFPCLLPPLSTPFFSKSAISSETEGFQAA